MTQVVVGLGSNIAPHFHLGRVLRVLHQHYRGLRVSPVYLAQAYGFKGPHFWNLVAAFNTQQPLPQVLSTLRTLETAEGRPFPAVKFANRCVDIDVLLYGDMQGAVAGVQLPRPDILEYAFVLKPLSDLFPTGCHPVLKQPYGQLWQAFVQQHAQRASQIQALPVAAYADFLPFAQG